MIFITFRGCSKNHEIEDFWSFGTTNLAPFANFSKLCALSSSLLAVRPFAVLIKSYDIDIVLH